MIIFHSFKITCDCDQMLQNGLDCFTSQFVSLACKPITKEMLSCKNSAHSAGSVQGTLLDVSSFCSLVTLREQNNGKVGNVQKFVLFLLVYMPGDYGMNMYTQSTFSIF